jgi:surface antigen
MNVLKNFEALFVITLGLACAANYALDHSAADTAAPITAAAAMTAPAAAQNMHVVVVSAKRMTAEEKQQSLNAERSAMASTPSASKI